VRSAGDTVLGADDKAGLAAILEAVRRLGERGLPHAHVTVVFSVAEEVGLVGAKALDPAVLAGADLALVLDAAGDLGGLITAAPTHYTFEATFTGTAAHAGVQPERGVSALLMASRAVCSMGLGRLDDATTANIGTIEGGIATNVVAPHARMTGECRSLERARVEALRAEMDATMRRSAEQTGGTVEVVWTREYAGYRVAETDPIYVLVAAACADIGVEPRALSTGGGADSNIFAEHGVPVLALACAMRDVHTPSEHIAVDDLELLTALLEAVLGRAADTTA
jgi:tripeptide aminopeptidase